jgi:tetratricopeptide (TPR) repeat protein
MMKKNRYIAGVALLLTSCANQGVVPVYEGGIYGSSADDSNAKAPVSEKAEPVKPGRDKNVEVQPRVSAPPAFDDKPAPVAKPERVRESYRAVEAAGAVSALLDSADEYRQQRDCAQAIVLSERALRLQPGLIRAYYILASCRIQNGEWQSAWQMANKGLQQRGGSRWMKGRLQDLSEQAQAMLVP